MECLRCPDGWARTGTGGNCTAWQIILADGRYALITDGDCNVPEYDSKDLVIALYRNPEAIEDSDEIAGPHYGNLASCLAWFAANRDKGASIDLSAYRNADGTLVQYSSFGSYTILYCGPKGECYCAKCASKVQIAHVGTYDEGDPLECESCGAEIESSYGPVEEKE